MSLFSPLLVVCVDQEEVNALTELASALGYPDAHIIHGGFAEAIQALNSRTSSPECIIVDIGTQGDEVLPQFDELALHCEPGVRVVVIGSANDIVFYRALRNRGVLEYFHRPVEVADVRSVLMQSSARQQPAGSSFTQGTVISCMSAASGDGASTLALNLAYSLASQYKQPTVLVDMDYQFGLAAKSLDLTAPFGIREIFDHPDRGLDDMLLSKMLVQYKDTLSIIAAPGELKLLPMVRPEVIRELVAILRTKYTFVVIDIPHVWTDWTAAALTYSNHVVMVAQLWLRSLTHASRLLAAWNQIGVSQGGVSLVINRSGAKFKEAISAQDFERICRRKIDAYIGNDAKAVTQAEHNAQTILEVDMATPIKEQISALARDLLVRYAGHSVLTQLPASGPKKNLLGFTRWRKE